MSTLADPGPKEVRAARVAASSRQMFDMRFGGLSHEAIIKTAATGRKRNTCIACMRRANGGPLPPAYFPGLPILRSEAARARRQPDCAIPKRDAGSARRPIFGWWFLTLLCRIPRLSDGSLALPPWRGQRVLAFTRRPGGTLHDGSPGRTSRGP